MSETGVNHGGAMGEHEARQRAASASRGTTPAGADAARSSWLQDGLFVSTAPAPRFSKYADVPSILVCGRESARRPLVSIVIPTYRRPDLLRQSIESALGQVDFDDYEVIVVDNDAESDETSETARMIASLRSDRLTYFRNARNIGMEGNFNRTFEIARGRYVCQLHDDDWLAPFYLNRLVAGMPQGAEFISGLFEMGEEDYSPDRLRPPPEKALRTKHLRVLDAIHAMVMVAPALILRSAVLEVGGFDGSHYPVLDYVLLTEFVKRRKSYVLKHVVSYYRISDSVTFKGDTLQRQIAGSLSVKRTLADEVPWLLGRLYYVEAVRRQFDRGTDHGINISQFVRYRSDRIADFLSRHRRIGVTYGRLMQSVRGVTQVCERVGAGAWTRSASHVWGALIGSSATMNIGEALLMAA